MNTTLVYNWDNKLSAASKGSDSIALKYDPDGNRIYKESTIGSTTTKRKYIVDRVDDLPTILLELDPMSNFAIRKTYIYGNSQILAQHDGAFNAPRYFYLHDRLGSVRQVINSSGAVVCRYTYDPFGQLHLTETEDNSALLNPFKYTGQYFDSETGLYYFRARMYDPYLGRFTAHDPINGKFTEPLSLHKYLYCGNDPINYVDPIGLFELPPWLMDLLGGIMDPPGYVESDTENTRRIMREARELVGRWWALGPVLAFGIPAYYDYKGSGSTFQLDKIFMRDSQFGNFLAGYTSYYNYVDFGDVGVRTAGHGDAMSEKLEDLLYNSDKKNLLWFDDPGSKYFISAGILMGREDRASEGRWRGTIAPFIHAKRQLWNYGIDRMTSTDLTSVEFGQELDNFTTFWNYSSE